MTSDCQQKAQHCFLLNMDFLQNTSKGNLETILKFPRLASIRLVLSTKPDNSQISVVNYLKSQIGSKDISLLINSRIDLVIPFGFDGIHLDDGPTRIREARSELGNELLVGAYCGSTRHSALLAGENGADYVSFGPLYQKSGVDTDLFELIQWWRDMTVLPCIAEGGINQSNAQQFETLSDFLLIEGSDLDTGIIH